MKRIFLASTIALSARAGVAKPDDTQLLSHVDKELSDLSESGLNKRAFSSPAAAFARSYGRYNQGYNAFKIFQKNWIKKKSRKVKKSKKIKKNQKNQKKSKKIKK